MANPGEESDPGEDTASRRKLLGLLAIRRVMSIEVDIMQHSLEAR